MAATTRDRIFICYSRKDARWLERIQTNFKALGLDSVWCDRDIKPGEDWHQTILEKLGQAKIAVLLVSTDFLASDYIRDTEFPLIWDAHERGELLILWFPVKPYSSRNNVLTSLEAVWNPEQPLSTVKTSARDDALVKIAEAVQEQFDSFHPSSPEGLSDHKPAAERVQRELIEIFAHPSWESYRPFLAKRLEVEATDPERLATELVQQSDLPRIIHFLVLAISDGFQTGSQGGKIAHTLPTALEKAEQAVGWLVHLSLNPEWLDDYPGALEDLKKGRGQTIAASKGFVSEILVSCAHKKHASFLVSKKKRAPEAPHCVRFDSQPMETGAETADAVQHILERVFTRAFPKWEVPATVDPEELNERVRRMLDRGEHLHIGVFDIPEGLTEADIESVGDLLPDLNILYFVGEGRTRAIQIEKTLSVGLSTFFEERERLLEKLPRTEP